jgi:hypothetical protein
MAMTQNKTTYTRKVYIYGYNSSVNNYCWVWKTIRNQWKQYVSSPAQSGTRNSLSRRLSSFPATQFELFLYTATATKTHCSACKLALGSITLYVYTDFGPQEFWIPLSRVSVSLSALGLENRRDTDRILRSILPEVRIRPGMTKQSSPSHWLRSWNNSKHSILIQVGEKLTYAIIHL